MIGEDRSAALPLFHLYGDPPDDQAFDFIHIERIASRAAIHEWTIRAHRHRNLFQILLIERGGGDMTFDAAKLAFAAPAAILIPAASSVKLITQPSVAFGSKRKPCAIAAGMRMAAGAANASFAASKVMSPPPRSISRI